MLIMYKIFTAVIYYATFPIFILSNLLGSTKWRRRLGYVAVEAAPKRRPTIWIHASSMGELKVLEILINEFCRQDDSLAFYITVMTETGFQKAVSFSDSRWPVSFLPLDYRSPIKRFLDSARPMAAVFIETEIWPYIIHELGKRNIPIFLANGRLSAKATGRYRRFRTGLRKIFANYTLILAQTEQDKERFVTIGADPRIVEVVGSLKFDAPTLFLPETEKMELRKTLPFPANSKILIAGSTREREPLIILNLFAGLRREFPNLRLILVPRHLDNIDDICRQTRDAGLKYIKHSELKSAENAEVVIVDRMGILVDLYQISDIAFVGGTLVEIGGHNILEPVWAGIPVLFGPSISNVRESAAYIIENRFGEMVRDAGDLQEKLRAFLQGRVGYRKREIGLDINSKAGETVEKILNFLRYDGKNLAKDN
jgi:tRNA (guanine-N7-)-methyltransferase